MIQETKQRSLIKALSWRLVIFVSDFLIAYLLTKKIEFAGSFATIKFFVGLALYYLHERSWNKIHWGRNNLTPHA